jgi:hypothetical protein
MIYLQQVCDFVLYCQYIQGIFSGYWSQIVFWVISAPHALHVGITGTGLESGQNILKKKVFLLFFFLEFLLPLHFIEKNPITLNGFMPEFSASVWCFCLPF